MYIRAAVTGWDLRKDRHGALAWTQACGAWPRKRGFEQMQIRDHGAYELYPLGEQAVVIRWKGVVSERNRKLVDGTVRRLAEHPPAAVVEWVRAYTTVTVYYDSWLVYKEGLEGNRSGLNGSQETSPYDQVCEWIHRRLVGLSEENAGELDGNPVVIPACFGGVFGMDLGEVAAQAGLTEERTIELFCSHTYTVYLIGFMPGFAYLGGLPDRLCCPRLDRPRPYVPAGSVGIAGTQTGVYPFASPGGWRIIGRTPETLFDPHRERPSLLQPGDRVRFEPLTPERYEELERELQRDASSSERIGGRDA
ncbi:5-oxoprolinase subunit PxpB [Paenibacillus naphthalenovorans]|uniref:5-oxoprolinase subunit PxpB n=2 Tax=Paenibacillus TaxID=44249 RepID=UPI00088F4027|nr:5-oxoprolinase subunit PxpB [Paenibacillus naphthalenovorans]SDJ02500.1 inhibitor of KinA [Paenibacillus naphthalenovorans]